MLVLLCSLACSTTPQGRVDDSGEPLDPEVAVLSLGSVQGLSQENGAIQFLGLPFAAPPVGDRRFQAPAPPQAWETTWVADTAPQPCLQYDSVAEEARGDEDCLYLNLWRPQAVPAEGAPVLVFIHGGGNVTGSAVEETSSGALLYDGGPLAAQEEVVVVTLQYRLNAFGYLADPSLDDAEPSGNYGPRDQVAALQWVQDHIAAFGGDPSRVLVFGESGGASDVCGLLATPSADGLFHGAGVMSGGCGGYQRDDMLEMGSTVADAVGCGDTQDRAACLRKANAEDVLMAVQRASTATGLVTAWAGPTIDGVFLPESPADALAAGRHHPVPVLIGVTADETSSPLFGIPFGLTEETYEGMVHTWFPLIATDILAAYPVASYGSPRAALVAMTTDLQFTCPTQVFAESASQWTPVYHYVYDHSYDGTHAGSFHPKWFGAAHGFELPLLFGTLDTYDDYIPSEGELTLGRQMGSMWAELARTGTPGADWPPYSSESPQSLVFTTPDLSTVQAYAADQCAFWTGF